MVWANIKTYGMILGVLFILSVLPDIYRTFLYIVWRVFTFMLFGMY